jgi:iron complex outermembrane receptor protein
MGFEQMIVGVRKRSEAAQSVPVAFSAISGERLRDQNPRDLRDLEGLSPDLIVIPENATPGGGGYAIRGVGVLDIERSFDPAVGIFVDGVYLSTIPASLLNTFDIEQVEILRGPQGTLFGKNTIGGAILVKHSRPTGAYGAQGSVTVGSHGRNDYGAVLNFPIMEERLAGKLSVFRNNDDGAFRNSFNGSRLGGDRFLQVAGDFLFNVNDDLDVLLRVERSEDRRESGPFVNIAGPGEATCAVLGFCGEPGNLERPNKNFTSFGDYDLDAMSMEINWSVSPNATVTSISGWRASDETQAQDFDATPADVFSTIRAQTARQFSEELRYAYGDGPLELVTGLYYLKTQYGLEQDVLFISEFLNTRATDIRDALGSAAPANQFLPGATRALQRAEQDAFTYAAFVQTDYALTRKLTLSVGTRYSFEEKDFKAVGGQRVGGLDFFAPRASEDEDFDEFSGKVGLDYRFSPDALAFLSYSKGVRSGGFNGRNTQPEDIGPYGQEKLKSLELGAKTSWFDDRLVLNGSVYMNRYDDKQEQAIRSDPRLGTLTIVDNAADADIWGYELESTARPLANLTLTGRLAYLDAEYDDFVADLDGPMADPRCPSAAPCLIPEDNSDLDIRLAPEWQWSVGAAYDIPVGQGVLTLSGFYRYVDSFQTEARGDPRGELDDIGTVDASIAYRFALSGRTRYTVRLFGRNLGNVVARNAAVIIPGSFAFSEVDEGATYGISVEFDWR